MLHTLLGPGPANTQRPVKILRGHPGPVIGPVPSPVEALDWRTEKSFFPLSRALPFRIIPSRMLFHLVRAVPSFPIAHDWLQGGMKKGAELRASTIFPPLPSLGKIGAQQKANYAKQWKKKGREGGRREGALGNSRVISMWVGWSRRR